MLTDQDPSGFDSPTILVHRVRTRQLVDPVTFDPGPRASSSATLGRVKLDRRVIDEAEFLLIWAGVLLLAVGVEVGSLYFLQLLQ